MRVAEADVIAKVQLTATPQQLNKRRMQSRGGYFDVPFRVLSVIKGEKQPPSIAVSYYLDESSTYSPSFATLNFLSDKNAIVFLSISDENVKGRLFFSQFDDNGIQPYDEVKFARLKAEQLKQEKLLKNFSCSSFAKKDSSDLYVKKLVDQLVTAEGKDDYAWQKLTMLPAKFSPALIRALDDSRHLKSPYVSVKVLPGPKRFEEVAHYGPKTVLDALSIVLNGHAGNFGGPSTSNGGSERERRAVVNYWKIFALHDRPK